jgi:hypothetical protein
LLLLHYLLLVLWRLLLQRPPALWMPLKTHVAGIGCHQRAQLPSWLPQPMKYCCHHQSPPEGTEYQQNVATVTRKSHRLDRPRRALGAMMLPDGPTHRQQQYPPDATAAADTLAQVPLPVTIAHLSAPARPLVLASIH